MRAPTSLLAAVAAAVVFAPSLQATGPAPFVEDLLATSVNIDGSRWEVFSDLGDNPPTVVELAEALAAGGTFAYDKMVLRNVAAGPGKPCHGQSNPGPHWGFESKDSDCVLRVLIQGDVGMVASPDASDEARVRVDRDLLEYLDNMSLYQNPAIHDVQSITRVVMGHELFHILQFGFNQWDPDWNAWLEGQAGFIQTIVDPETEDDPSTFWAHNVNPFQVPAPPFTSNGSLYARVEIALSVVTGPSAKHLCSHSYDYSHYWGHVYDRDGGLATLKDVLSRIGTLPAGTECHDGMHEVLDAALGAAGGEDANHTESLRSFALAVYARDFTWGEPGGPDHAWGPHLREVWRLPEASVPAQHRVGPWGMQYTTLPAVGRYAVQPLPLDGQPWAFRAFLKDPDGSVEVIDLPDGQATTIDAAGHKEVVLNAVRLAPTDGFFAVALLPAT